MTAPAPPSRDDVLTAVKAAFPGEAGARVLKALDAYGAEPHERERERVQLAILKLCGGSEVKVGELVAVVKRDYRDILLWAEYPEEAKLDAPEKREGMADALRKLGIEPPPGLAE